MAEKLSPAIGRHVGTRLAVALGVAITAALVLGRSTAALSPGDGATTAAIVIAEVYLCVALALLATFGRSRADREDVLGLAAPREGGLRVGLLAWAGAYALAAALFGLVALAGGASAEVVDVLMGVGADGGRLADASWPVALVILVRICVLVPVAEELLFRGALFAWLRRRMSARWTIGVTAALFGLMHQMPVFIPLAAVVGVAAGWLRERTGSTVVPIVMHALQNLVVVVVSLLATGWDATLPMK